MPSWEMACVLFSCRISDRSPLENVNFGALTAISRTPSYLKKRKMLRIKIHRVFFLKMPKKKNTTF